ncbi:MAG TPA: hypothetical protein VER17_13515 [Tepidisphaeraceae bacterium]|nr:hypothetical protein [Tepidisphaeraceae bacterium]
MPDRPSITYEARPRLRTWRDDISAEWTRFASGFTRENIVSNLKTLAWVVPLTLLIWIYAEREQVAPAKDVAVPFELTSVDADRAVSLKPPQDKNLVLELQGPQARLQDVLNKLRGGTMPQGLKIDVPTTYQVNREHALPTLDLVRSQKIFTDAGVTVLGVQPARLEIVVDEVVEREARIVGPSGVKNLEATFDPPTVKLRGPLSVLNKALASVPQEENGRLLLHADLPQHILRKPDHYELTDVVLTRPPELQDDRVSIVALPKIRAVVDVRQADKTYTRPSMTVTQDVPDGLLDKYKMVDFRAVLQNVTLVGPPELIEAMQRPDFQPQPKAHVVVTAEDATGERRTKVVVYDLPKGVDVVPEDQKRTVEFRLVDRSTLPLSTP